MDKDQRNTTIIILLLLQLLFLTFFLFFSSSFSCFSSCFFSSSSSSSSSFYFPFFSLFFFLLFLLLILLQERCACVSEKGKFACAAGSAEWWMESAHNHFVLNSTTFSSHSYIAVGLSTDRTMVRVCFIDAWDVCL